MKWGSCHWRLVRQCEHAEVVARGSLADKPPVARTQILAVMRQSVLGLGALSSAGLHAFGVGTPGFSVPRGSAESMPRAPAAIASGTWALAAKTFKNAEKRPVF